MMSRTAQRILVTVALTVVPMHAWAQPSPEVPESVTPNVARQRITRATVSVRDGTLDRGRGVVLSGDGRIVTALAAVQGAQNLRVVYPDGRVDRARVVAVDVPWGIAVIQGNGVRWPEGVSLAERDARSGDVGLWMPAAGARLVIGNLARRRSLVGADDTLLRDAWVLTPIPPRSAAGAGVLQQSTATLVAVIVPPVGGVAETGAESLFAVPVTVLRAVIRRAAENARPWLGVVTREIRMGEDPILGSGGLRVIEVQSGSPAQRAGLRAGDRGDVIVSVDHRRVTNLTELGASMEGRRPGDVVSIQVMRGNAQLDVQIQLDALPSEPVRR
jgi:serine protease Do